MPKQTFFNLPEEKREKILDLAIEEFSKKPYSKASLSKIVAEAGIAKGSMYQYFENKKDLFTYLLEIAALKKINYIKSQKFHDDEDFFTMFQKMCLAGIKFNLENPRLGHLVARVLDPTAEPFLRELYSHLKKTSLNFLIQIITENQKNNRLRRDVDPKLIAHMINGFLGNGLIEYFLQDLNLTYEEFLTKKEGIRNLTDEKVSVIIDQVIKVIRNGIEKEHFI